MYACHYFFIYFVTRWFFYRYEKQEITLLILNTEMLLLILNTEMFIKICLKNYNQRDGMIVPYSTAQCGTGLD